MRFPKPDHFFGSRGSFSTEHNEGEPNYVYVKPVTKEPAQSNLEIAMKSGQQVTPELISDGVTGNRSVQPVDFLIQYRSAQGFLVQSLDARTRVSTTDSCELPYLDEMGENKSRPQLAMCGNGVTRT
jgi:hypothetical protein